VPLISTATTELHAYKVLLGVHFQTRLKANLPGTAIRYMQGVLGFRVKGLGFRPKPYMQGVDAANSFPPFLPTTVRTTGRFLACSGCVSRSRRVDHNFPISLCCQCTLAGS